MRLRHVNQAKYLEFIENLLADISAGIVAAPAGIRAQVQRPIAAVAIEYLAEIKYPSEVPIYSLDLRSI